ncbi:MAG: U32 family peptidase [Candidatus Riflebacteria bacterium]|nr:U32 family peptidase [Candidatus Riflebacteria bacterium]
MQKKSEKKLKKLELLAPAGDQNSFKAALVAGADAIYLGGKRFGARAFAGNFDESALKWARRVTRNLGKKLYITFNTLVFDHEWRLVREALDFYEHIQPDAIIIQDLGIASELLRRKSSLEVHLSTQAAWDGMGGAEFLKSLNISRVILPREMSLDLISQISSDAPFELEMFVHGAMCFSISGRCFWSNSLGTRSGNRGTCAQPCRKPYSKNRDDKKFYFSPKDLNLYEHIDNIQKAGISSLKIEGRMKDADYVYSVVRAYRNAIDKINETPEANEVARDKELLSVFSRGFQSGFISEKPQNNWFTAEESGKTGEFAGKILEKQSSGLTKVSSLVQLKSGDGIFWRQNDERAGARLTYVEQLPSAGKAAKENLFLVRGLPDLPQGTDFFRNDLSAKIEWEKEWNPDWERISLDLFWSGNLDVPLAVESVCNSVPIRVQSTENLSIAHEKGLDEGILQERFEILGNDFKSGRHIFTALGKNLFLSPSSLKKLKRAFLEKIASIQSSKLPSSSSDNLKARLPNPLQVVSKPNEIFKLTRKRKIFVRFWNEIDIKGQLKADCWIPRLDEKTAVSGNKSFWLPFCKNYAERGILEKMLQEIPESEILCAGWEAFYFSKQVKKHTYRFDWLFNLVNEKAVELIIEKGFIATAGREWPVNCFRGYAGTLWTAAVNPLVSISRFTQQISETETVTNSHGDRFFVHNIGNGFSGLFLQNRQTGFPVPDGVDVQIDICPGPGDNPAKILAILKSCFPEIIRL